MEYNPYSIRRALENTAMAVDGAEPFAQGRGLLQVLPAFEYLKTFADVDGPITVPLYYNVRIPSLSNARGIYLREIQETQSAREFAVEISPLFHKDAPSDSKVAFDMRLSLHLSTDAKWVHIPEHFTLSNSPRSFSIMVDCASLATGEVYYTELLGYDVTHPERKSIFRVPITVIKPHRALLADLKFNCALGPGTILRHFYTVPQDAAWINVKVTRSFNDSDDNTAENVSSRIYYLYLVQLLPQTSQTDSTTKRAFRLEPGATFVQSAQVQPGFTVEICMAQFWSSLDSSTITVDVDFNGLRPNAPTVHLHGGEGKVPVTLSLSSSGSSEKVLPEAKLNAWIQRVRPAAFTVKPLTSRDAWPEDRQIHALTLTYNFTLEENTDITPRFPLINDFLYESPLESQLCMIHEAGKRYVGASDAFTKKTKLPKGKYVARLQLRHESPSVLKRHTTMLMMLEQSIKDIPLVVHSSSVGPIVCDTAMTVR